MPKWRTSRRTAIFVGTLVVVIGAGVGTAIAVSGSGGGSGSTRLITSVARRGDLAQTVSAPYTLAYGSSPTLAFPNAGTVIPSGGGVVTGLNLSVGQPVPTLAPLAEVNGLPVFGIPSTQPLYRNIVEGDSGNDVLSLQQALNAVGYGTAGDTVGTFGSATLNALEQWQSANLLSVTGSANLDAFTWFPPNAVVLSLSVSNGSKVSGGVALASVADSGGLVAQADVAQADVAGVKLGQTVTLTFDSLPGTTERALVAGLPAQAETSSGSATAGNSTPVQYMVTVVPGALPTGARAGMTGQAQIAVQSRTSTVIVPSAAVGGNANQPTVQVVVNGHATTRAVQVGLVTNTDTEILAGVEPGDIVVIGRQQTGPAPSTAPVTVGGGGGLGGGGGGLGGGGGGFGGGGGGRGLGGG